MNQKQQIIHIGGGEAFDSKEQYLEYLKIIDLWHMEEGVFNPWYKNYEVYLNADYYEILSIPMPAKENADYDAWKIWFERHMSYFQDQVILVGHSLGGIFLAKYLSENLFNKIIKQLHLVAPVYDSVNEREQLGNFALQKFPGKMHENTIHEIYIYHSKDDTVVPISESEKYHEKLPGSQFQVFEDRFHFIGEDFPELFSNITNLDKIQ